MCIVTIFGNVSDPLLGFVLTFLLYFKVPNSQTTSSEHWYLELHSDRRSLPGLVRFGHCGRGYCWHDLLLVTLELFYPPEYTCFVWFVFCFTLALWKYFYVGSIWRDWYFNYNVVGEIGVLEDRSELNLEFNSLVFNKLLYDWSNLEWQVDIAGDSISHHLEEAIRWDKCDWPVSVEPS